ncbi:MAG: zf-HC2 domain-containing protein [Chloroflexi bacterium]|nr:zf-HC2 domain-containing protein [Chloroflexota bacterium]
MRCKDVGEKLLYYLNDELAGEQGRAIALHLSECVRCRRELEALSASQELLRQGASSMSKRVAPPWSWFELRQRLSGLGRHRRVGIRAVLARAGALVLENTAVQLVLAGLLAVALIFGTVASVQRIFGPSQEALAAQIVGDAPEAQVLLEGEPSRHTARVSGAVGYVLSLGPSGEYILTYVDLDREVTTRQYRLTALTLEKEDEAKATGILEADPLPQRLLRAGWVVKGAYLLPSGLKIELSGGEVRVWSESRQAGVLLAAYGRQWLARVELAGGAVLDISPAPTRTYLWSSLVAGQSYDQIVDIARSDAVVVDLMDRGASVISVATGNGKMADKASVLLSLGEDRWIVKIDLPAATVTSVRDVPVATWGKGYFFRPKDE